MNDHSPKSVRERLMQLRDELLAEQEAARDDTAPVELDQTCVGRLSRMDSMQQQAMALEQKRRRGVQLQRIEGAFQRLDRGTWGQCVTCSTEIAPERLEFDPTTFFCQSCATRAERR